jgi:hypothetical protein
MNVINKDVVKMNEKEEDHEIEKIRMKKMKELIEAQRRQEQSNQKVVSLRAEEELQEGSLWTLSFIWKERLRVSRVPSRSSKETGN